ncbi:MAG: hypothetical protein AMXMBFR64_53260 [Myxococcales bacterium]
MLAAATPAIVLTGARQSGKTTLLRSVFPEHHYVTLDLPSVAERAERDPSSFLRDHPPPLIVDEVQYAPALFRHLKVVIDADRHAHGRFILTGSQKFPLMKEVADSLAGRCVWLELEGFSLTEVARVWDADVGAPGVLERILVRGGFPELWTNPRLPREDFLATYVATCLERDVRQLINVGSLRDFERFLRACAARNGQLLDRSALARDVGVSPKTANAWLSVLSASNQVALLEPWFVNAGKRMVKSPKLYLTDTGLCAFLLGVTEETVARSPYLGSLWETLVFAELRKALMVRHRSAAVWFYRDDRQLEVDFLVTAGGRADVVEAKWTELPDARDARGVRALLAHGEARQIPEMGAARGFVVCRTAEPFPIRGDGPRVDALSLPRFIGDVLGRAEPGAG